MGGLMGILLLVVIVVVLPIALFFGIIGLTLFIWCWRRIGPYFVNFGRWIANWQNFVPCSCIGCLSMILLLVVVPLLLPSSFGILRVLGLVLLGLIGFVCGIFALIVLTVRLFSWGWPRFRRWFWQFPPRLQHLLWKRLPDMVETVMPGGPSAGRKKSTRKPVAGPESTRAEAPAEPQTQAMPPQRRSWLDMAWLWSLLWGKPQQPVKRKPKASVVSTQVQPQVTVSMPEKAKPKVAAKPRTGLRPLTWRFGVFVLWMRRQMQRMWGKPAPVAKKTMGVQPKPNAPAAPLASQSTPSVAVPGTKTQQAKEKPSKGSRNGLMAAVNFVRKRFWLSVFWVVEKVRTGVDLILRLLHLNGRKK